jgi:hypothetical protein
MRGEMPRGMLWEMLRWMHKLPNFALWSKTLSPNKHMKTENETPLRAEIGTRKICFPYHVGQLQAILRYCLPYGVIPGVTITDKAALNEWVETEIERCIQEAEQFEKEAGKPLDN